MKIYAEVLIESVEQAEALPEDTPVLIKADGEAIGMEFARDLLPEHMTPVHHARHYALVAHEVHERKVRAQGEIVPGIGGGGKMLYTDFGQRQPHHERMVWSTKWQKLEDQG